MIIEYREPEESEEKGDSELPLRMHSEVGDITREKVTGLGKPVIEMDCLRKEFWGGFGEENVVAVRDVTINMYENQVFCLLGHNGAGKTTTINMLTGMSNITSGNAKINGYDVITEMNRIRTTMGVCPQHDVYVFSPSFLPSFFILCAQSLAFFDCH